MKKYRILTPDKNKRRIENEKENYFNDIVDGDYKLL
jgi:hypothetical protein